MIRNKSSIRILSALGVALLAGAAQAAEDLAAHGDEALSDAAHHAAESHGAGNPMSFEMVPFISTLVAFGIVYFILSSKVWPVINKALDAREQKIRSEIDEAEAARKQANAALQEYEKALAEARTEAGKILDQAKQEQQKVAAQLKSQTEAEIVSMKEAAARDIDAAKRAAISEIYSEMASTSTAIASKILQRELNANDQQALVEQSLGELQAVGAN